MVDYWTKLLSHGCSEQELLATRSVAKFGDRVGGCGGVSDYVGVCWVGGWMVWGLVRKKSEVSLEHAAKREPAISSQHWSYTTGHLRSNELFSRCPATWLLPAWWHGDGARSKANFFIWRCVCLTTSGRDLKCNSIQLDIQLRVSKVIRWLASSSSHSLWHFRVQMVLEFDLNPCFSIFVAVFKS